MGQYGGDLRVIAGQYEQLIGDHDDAGRQCERVRSHNASVTKLEPISILIVERCGHVLKERPQLLLSERCKRGGFEHSMVENLKTFGSDPLIDPGRQCARG